MKRKRSYITLPEKLAATLACLLPQGQRDDLRDRKVSATEIISLFHFDHIVLHAFYGADLWYNLDPKLVLEHQEKSRTDTSKVAKAKRIDKKWPEFTKTMNPGKALTHKHQWPTRKIQSRGFK